jgi:hypothetical protein
MCEILNKSIGTLERSYQQHMEEDRSQKERRGNGS